MTELNQESVKAMIAEAVKGLNDKLVEREKKIADLEVALRRADDETEKLRTNRDQILREKRELEGRPVKEKTEDTFAITQEEARNPELYRRAKAKAQAAGFELKILEPTNRNGKRAPDRFENDETIFINHLKVREGGPELYRALKAEAEKAGKRLHVATGVEQWPREAFDATG